MTQRTRWAPKLPVSMIVRLYDSDAEMQHDNDLLDDVGWRLFARCQDVLLVSDSKIVCPECGTTFQVAWIAERSERKSACAECGWTITAHGYHASFKGRDLNGVGAREAFAAYVAHFPRLTTYADRMLAIDRLVHAVHTTGGLAARNLFEGRAREVVARLDSLAAGRQQDRRTPSSRASPE